MFLSDFQFGQFVPHNRLVSVFADDGSFSFVCDIHILLSAADKERRGTVRFQVHADKPSAHLDTSVGQNLGVFGGIFQRVCIDDSGKAIYLRLFRRGGEMPMIRIFLEIAFIIGTQPVLCRIKETTGGIRLQCSA